jgi:hypothetical protein
MKRKNQQVQIFWEGWSSSLRGRSGGVFALRLERTSHCLTAWSAVRVVLRMTQAGTLSIPFVFFFVPAICVGLLVLHCCRSGRTAMDKEESECVACYSDL